MSFKTFCIYKYLWRYKNNIDEKNRDQKTLKNLSKRNQI